MAGSVAEGRLQVLQIYRLLQLVHTQNTAQIKKLVDGGVHNLINITEPKEGKGVLHVASVANDMDMVELLMSLGAHPDVQDRRGRTAVMVAAELGHDCVVTLLAEKNADMNLTDIDGRGTILIYKK